jgi:hypothetical protein
MFKLNSIYAGLIVLNIVSCKDTTKTTNFQEETTETILTENQADAENSSNTSSNFFLNLKLGHLKGAAEHELRSSNALKKEHFTTTFLITTPEAIYDKHPLEISFIKHLKTDNPKLEAGIYPIKSLVAVADSETPCFNMLGVVDEHTYQNAIAAGILDDIRDSYVILEDNDNTMTITSVKAMGKEEDGAYYKTGQQLVTGKGQVSLFKIATEETLELEFDFKINHDWTISH